MMRKFFQTALAIIAFAGFQSFAVTSASAGDVNLMQYAQDPTVKQRTTFKPIKVAGRRGRRNRRIVGGLLAAGVAAIIINQATRRHRKHHYYDDDYYYDDRSYSYRSSYRSTRKCNRWARRCDYGNYSACRKWRRLCR